MREVLATPAELISAAAGSEIIVRTACGETVRLRVPTAHEYKVQAGGTIPESLAQAMVRPLPRTIGVL